MIMIQLGQNLDPGDLRICIWQLAQNYELANCVQSMQDEMTRIGTVLTDIKVQKDDKFQLSTEQKVCPSCPAFIQNSLTLSQQSLVKNLSKDLIFNPKRTGWMQLHMELNVSPIFIENAHSGLTEPQISKW